MKKYKIVYQTFDEFGGSRNRSIEIAAMNIQHAIDRGNKDFSINCNKISLIKLIPS